MKNFAFLTPPPAYIEIGEDSVKAFRENNSIDLPLEREADGRLTGPGRAKLIAALKQFLAAKNWQPRVRAWCALSARGVSLRRLSLPVGTKEESYQRLLLQIEAEFPLPPGELAWGSQSLPGPTGRQELLVAAIKKETLANYQEILRACGVEPIFTLAALARQEICPPTADFCALLDIGNHRSELALFEKGILLNSRLLSGGSENVSGLTNGQMEVWLQSIAPRSGGKLFISGNNVSGDFVAQLARSSGSGWQGERLDVGEQTAAISGLKKIAESGHDPVLVIRVGQSGQTLTGLATMDLKKWGTRAVALAAVLILWPYAEALLLKPHLEKKVAAFKTESKRLVVIDRELDFLRGLKQSQPPYLDLLSVFSKSVPPGTHFDALSLNSQGDVSLRCAFHDGQQVADFRTKLIVSGFFTNVTVEEQVPTPDRQKVNVRISAQEKPAAQLQALAASLETEEAAKAPRSPALENPASASLNMSVARKEGQ